ncbi:MAG: thioredoxin family protein [Chloroflexi bacterium]|nr:thioredoxin family protein [Chloroflexota bacterium]
MHKSWHAIKGYGMSALAFISCPCHLPITLPLLVAVTAGTAFSAWLQNNFLPIGAGSTLIFIASLVLALRWSRRPTRVVANQRHSDPAKVVLVTSRRCESCEVAADLWADLASDNQFQFQEVLISSKAGRSLAARHNILRTPTTIIDGNVAFKDVPERDRALLALNPDKDTRQ